MNACYFDKCPLIEKKLGGGRGGIGEKENSPKTVSVLFPVLFFISEYTISHPFQLKMLIFNSCYF